MGKIALFHHLVFCERNYFSFNLQEDDDSSEVSICLKLTKFWSRNPNGSFLVLYQCHCLLITLLSDSDVLFLLEIISHCFVSWIACIFRFELLASWESYSCDNNFLCSYFVLHMQGRHGCDHTVVGFTTTYAISAYHH
jgi:hypothetical protein